MQHVQRPARGVQAVCELRPAAQRKRQGQCEEIGGCEGKEDARHGELTLQRSGGAGETICGDRASGAIWEEWRRARTTPDFAGFSAARQCPRYNCRERGAAAATELATENGTSRLCPCVGPSWSLPPRHHPPPAAHRSLTRD